jgi:hypothetical protein
MTMTFDRVCLRCGSGEFITDRAPRPTPSTPGAPVEGRDDVDAVVPAEVDGLVGQLREKAAESGGYTGALCDAAAREIRRLRSALAEAEVRLAGAEGRARSVLNAKDYWATRASDAERKLAEAQRDGERWKRLAARWLLIARQRGHGVPDDLARWADTFGPWFGDNLAEFRAALSSARSPREDATTSTGCESVSPDGWGCCLWRGHEGDHKSDQGAVPDWPATTSTEGTSDE